MGTELSPEAVKVFVMDLARLPEADVFRALERCRREVKGINGFAPKLILQDVLERAGVITQADADQLDGEAAWATVLLLAEQFARRNSADEVVLRRQVGKPAADCPKCAGEGWFFVDRAVAQCNCRTVVEVPFVEERTIAAVRGMGGWATFKDIPTKSFPFVKRDFLLEYGRQEKAERYKQLQAPSTAGLPASRPQLALDGDQVQTDSHTPHRLDSLLERILAAPAR